MEEQEKIRKNPYIYICNYVESVYPKIGKKTFEVLALMPCSLIIPDLPYSTKKVRSNINALFLAPSGSGKTSVAKLFSSFTYSPLEFESVTSAKLEGTIAQNPVFSLVVGDFARMSRDPVLLKVIEGILGEEKSIKRATMRKEVNLETEGIGLLCGVSIDLSHYITSGLIFRVVPILIGHNSDEHADIGSHIKDSIGNGNGNSVDKEQVIKDFYMDLAMIQGNKNSEINQVTGYHIEESFRERAYAQWNKLTKPIVQEIGLNFFRELQEFFRFLVSSAFINIYNRKVENGVLHPTEEDFEVAYRLMKRNIMFKFRLLRSEGFAKGIKNAKDFQQIMKSDKVPEEYKELIRNLVQVKGDRIIKRA